MTSSRGSSRGVRPVPLTSPDGTVFAWACGHCRRVGAGHSYLTTPYTDEQVASLAENSRSTAIRCCACRDCGGLYPWTWKSGLDSDRPLGTCKACWTPERAAAAKARRDAQTARIEAEHEALARSLDKALQRDAAEALREAMSDLSEEYYCAGWLIGLEHTLWQCWERAPFKWGFGVVGTEDADRLRRLHEKAGGWWTTVDHWQRFVTTEEWLRIADAPADEADTEVGRG